MMPYLPLSFSFKIALMRTFENTRYFIRPDALSLLGYHWRFVEDALLDHG
jgi:hypothetical protein